VTTEGFFVPGSAHPTEHDVFKHVPNRALRITDPSEAFPARRRRINQWIPASVDRRSRSDKNAGLGDSAPGAAAHS